MTRIVILATAAVILAMLILPGCRSNDTGRNQVIVYGGGEISKAGAAGVLNRATTAGAINVIVVTGDASQTAGKEVGVNPVLSAAASKEGAASTGNASASSAASQQESATIAKPAATPSSTVTPPAAAPSSNVTPAATGK